MGPLPRYRHVARLSVALSIAWATAAAQQQSPTPAPVLGPNAVPTHSAKSEVEGYRCQSQTLRLTGQR